MIRVTLFSDKPIILEGLRRMLTNSVVIAVVSESESLTDMHQQIASYQPDVVVMDAVLVMLDATLADIVRIIQSIPQPPKVLIVDLDVQIDFMVSSSQPCVFGYLLYYDAPSLLGEAIQAIANGERWASPKAKERLAQAALKQSDATNDTVTVGTDLTYREREVLLLLVEGKRDKEIGKASCRERV